MTAGQVAGSRAVTAAVSGWLARYTDAHRDELATDDEFARWLEEDYAPIAGGWHY
jgi:hypothetical protein